MTEANSHAPPLKLAADLGIEQAAALHQQLQARIADVARVVIDASDVVRLHGAALQLFCLFCRDRREAGREVSFISPPTVLLQAALLAGATSLLGLDGACA